MLPSNPRAAVKGLPTNPRPRPHSTKQQDPLRPQQIDRPNYPAQPTHSHKAHFATTTSSSSNPRLRSRLLPSSEHQESEDHRPKYSYDHDAQIEERLSHKSHGSTSSSGSSLLDRMRSGSNYPSSDSSQTSIEDGHQTFEPKQAQNDLSRSLGAVRTSDRWPYYSGDNIPPKFNIGDGTALWTQVATVAGALTISVSRAWATNVASYSGEETPPGQESRLTRAMKAYHLAKAQDPSDLPLWLFDEDSRRRLPEASKHINDYKASELFSNSDGSRPRGLHDMYDAAARNPQQHNFYAGDDSQPSQASDRLKAMRDARRNAPTARAGPRRTMEELGYTSSAIRVDDKPKISERHARLGLPSGPRRL